MNSRIENTLGPESFLNDTYSLVYEPVIKAAKEIDTWVVTDMYYAGWRKFLKLFEEGGYDKKHKDFGNGYLYYKNDMEYPSNIDPTLDLHTFINFQLQNMPINVGDFKKAWGVKYPPGGYSALHCHKPGKQLTAILFLDDCRKTTEYPLAGSLTTLQPCEDSVINYVQHPVYAGGMVIMDGKVFHGTYPTLDERRVFVVDFDYTTRLA